MLSESLFDFNILKNHRESSFNSSSNDSFPLSYIMYSYYLKKKGEEDELSPEFVLNETKSLVSSFLSADPIQKLEYRSHVMKLTISEEEKNINMSKNLPSSSSSSPTFTSKLSSIDSFSHSFHHILDILLNPQVISYLFDTFLPQKSLLNENSSQFSHNYLEILIKIYTMIYLNLFCNKESIVNSPYIYLTSSLNILDSFSPKEKFLLNINKTNLNESISYRLWSYIEEYCLHDSNIDENYKSLSSNSYMSSLNEEEMKKKLNKFELFFSFYSLIVGQRLTSLDNNELILPISHNSSPFQKFYIHHDINYFKVLKKLKIMLKYYLWLNPSLLCDFTWSFLSPQPILCTYSSLYLLYLQHSTLFLYKLLFNWEIRNNDSYYSIKSSSNSNSIYFLWDEEIRSKNDLLPKENEWVSDFQLDSDEANQDDDQMDIDNQSINYTPTSLLGPSSNSSSTSTLLSSQNIQILWCIPRFPIPTDLNLEELEELSLSTTLNSAESFNSAGLMLKITSRRIRFLLSFIPFTIPFQYRVHIFHSLINSNLLLLYGIDPPLIISNSSVSATSASIALANNGSIQAAINQSTSNSSPASASLTPSRGGITSASPFSAPLSHRRLINSVNPLFHQHARRQFHQFTTPSSISSSLSSNTIDMEVFDHSRRNMTLNVRRSHLLTDIYKTLSDCSLRDVKKHKIKVSFINAQGLIEAGIDGGGLFKELIDQFALNILESSARVEDKSFDFEKLIEEKDKERQEEKVTNDNIRSFEFDNSDSDSEDEFDNDFFQNMSRRIERRNRELIRGNTKLEEEVESIYPEIFPFFTQTHDHLLTPSHDFYLLNYYKKQINNVEDLPKKKSKLILNHLPVLLKFYNILGMFIGKIILEKQIFSLEFSYNFLNLILGYSNTFNDLVKTDKELYKSLKNLEKLNENELNELNLSFELTEKIHVLNQYVTVLFSSTSQQKLVTKSNLREYFLYYSNYKQNLMISAITRSFLSGFHSIIPKNWIRIFNSIELQWIISGDNRENEDGKILNIKNLRENIQYHGYKEDEPYINEFWKIVSSFSIQDQQNFLRFITSSPRPPLLGFSQLNPKFTIRRVAPYNSSYQERDPFELFRSPSAISSSSASTSLYKFEVNHSIYPYPPLEPFTDGAAYPMQANEAPRLPSSATCMNLLKLPYYPTSEILREKLLYAIRSKSGFELS